MEFKLLEKEDLEMMRVFKDEEHTEYKVDNLKRFIENKDCYGFIIKNEDKIIAFAYGYIMLRPDGRKMFYIHSIDVIKEYQNNGYGTKLIKYCKEYAKSIGCYKVFIITNKNNVSACKCYENAGGINEANDNIVYIFKV